MFVFQKIFTHVQHAKGLIFESFFYQIRLISEIKWLMFQDESILTDALNSFKLLIIIAEKAIPTYEQFYLPLCRTQNHH